MDDIKKLAEFTSNLVSLEMVKKIFPQEEIQEIEKIIYHILNNSDIKRKAAEIYGNGLKINAIKYYRDHIPSSLKEAKYAVEALPKYYPEYFI